MTPLLVSCVVGGFAARRLGRRRERALGWPPRAALGAAERELCWASGDVTSRAQRESLSGARCMAAAGLAGGRRPAARMRRNDPHDAGCPPRGPPGGRAQLCRPPPQKKTAAQQTTPAGGGCGGGRQSQRGRSGGPEAGRAAGSTWLLERRLTRRGSERLWASERGTCGLVASVGLWGICRIRPSWAPRCSLVASFAGFSLDWGPSVFW